MLELQLESLLQLELKLEQELQELELARSLNRQWNMARTRIRATAWSRIELGLDLALKLQKVYPKPLYPFTVHILLLPYWSTTQHLYWVGIHINFIKK